MKELAILLADKDAQMAVEALLKRPAALGIRPFAKNGYEIFVHHLHDPACCSRAHEYMRRCLSTHRHLMVLFDFHGCGVEHRMTPTEIEASVESNLAQCGWQDRCCAVALDPELEIWVWSDSTHVEAELGWTGKPISMKDWLVQKKFLGPQDVKPAQPKEAMRAALREVGKPVSAAIFGSLAEKVGFGSCTDRAFLKFKTSLQQWFGNK